MSTSQPIDTQDCVSSESPTAESEATTQLPLAQSDTPGGSRATASPSVFVQLRTSPRKTQRIEPLSTVSDQEYKEPNTASTEDVHSQNLFETQTQDGSQPTEVKQQDDEDVIAPKRRNTRPCIDSQDDVVEQKLIIGDEPMAGAGKLKEKVLPDGRIIKYAHTDVVRRYYDASGHILHTEPEEVDSTQGSSGYLADHSCSGTSSGASHNSQELSLKAHRSAEDGLFVSPKVPLLRTVKSVPLTADRPKSATLAPLPTNHTKVLTAQQRRNILSAITGNKARPEIKEKVVVELSPLPNLDMTPPNPTNISVISSIHADSQNADTEPLSHSDSYGGTAKAQTKLSPDPMPVRSAANITNTANGKSSRHIKTDGGNGSKHVRIVRRRKRSRSSSSKQVSFQHAESTNARPANKRARKPSSSNESSSSAVPYGRSARNLPAPSHKELVVGARVVAKWPSDNYYYMGVVAQKDKGMWQVIYDDENTCRVSSKDLLVIKCIPKRHAVHARRPESEEYVPAIVVENEDEQYAVSLINEPSPGVIRVAAKDICLDSGQFINLTTLLASQGSTTEGESNDNAISTVSRTNPSTSTPVLPARPAVQSAKKAKIFTDVQRSPIKSRTSHSGDKEPAKGVVSLKFGETATTSLDIFCGFVFMVTSLNKNKLVSEVMDRLNIGDDDSQSQSQVDSSDEVDDAVNLETLCAKIEALGGMVIEKFDADAVAGAQRSYLISSGFRRTVKYLQCLAANIPPVSYSWVDQCFAEKEFIPETGYLLPAGVNTNGSVVEWGSRSVSKPTPLKGVSILLSTKETKSTFTEDWTSILKVAGALVMKKNSMALGVNPDYIMTNAKGCSKVHLNQATRLNIPVVDTEWAIQLLINGTPP